MTQGVSYDAPVLVAISKTLRASGMFLNMGATGGNMGTMHTSPAARYSSTACEATEWISDTALVCKMRNTTAASQAVMVATVSTQVATHSAAYSDPTLRMSIAFGESENRR